MRLGNTAQLDFFGLSLETFRNQALAVVFDLIHINSISSFYRLLTMMLYLGLKLTFYFTVFIAMHVLNVLQQIS